jgi:hypothetical protein
MKSLIWVTSALSRWKSCELRGSPPTGRECHTSTVFSTGTTRRYADTARRIRSSSASRMNEEARDSDSGGNRLVVRWSFPERGGVGPSSAIRERTSPTTASTPLSPPGATLRKPRSRAMARSESLRLRRARRYRRSSLERAEARRASVYARRWRGVLRRAAWWAPGSGWTRLLLSIQGDPMSAPLFLLLPSVVRPD